MADSDTTTQEIVVCTPCSDIAEYKGTRAALEAEGIIPAGIKWPEGFNDLSWDDGQIRYSLYRERPEGAKGPRKQFLGVDWWVLRFDTFLNESIESLGARMVKRKAKELADIIYSQSAKGQAESWKQWKLYLKAEEDERFQEFKALIPCITRPKRGRKPKEAQEAKASHN